MDGSNAEQEGRVSHVTPLKVETGIEVSYAETSWRAVQSVIDITQNHLDANTARYEKRLLASAGVSEYKPQDHDQRQTISLLNQIKYAGDTDDVQALYTELSRKSATLPQPEDLRSQLEEINFTLPNLRLKVTNGTESKFVPYAEMAAVPEEWRVVGFRMYDEGSGFDPRLLGMVGASTRQQDTSKRGGLGEGLKMSFTHLLRSGADVRLMSRNDDQLWIARPVVEKGSVKVIGKQRHGSSDEPNGSLTDVDFSSSRVDSDVRMALVEALDPRLGEGLSKLALDYRDSKFLPIIDQSRELSTEGVPGGRIYVKGLLVEETPDVLLSYNLRDKWAIAGRDRKTARNDILEPVIKDAIIHLDNPEQVVTIMQALSRRADPHELRLLSKELVLAEDVQDVWRQALQEAYEFRPGEVLFASDQTDHERTRYARERGYQIITIPSNHMNAIAMLEQLYPDQAINIDKYDGSGASRKTMDTPLKAKDVEVRPIDEATEHALKRLRTRFMIEIEQTNDFLRKHGGSGLLPSLTESLAGVRFVAAGPDREFVEDAVVDYDPSANVMYIRDREMSEFGTRIDLFTQLLKAQQHVSVFTPSTQEIVTYMAAAGVGSIRPDSIADFIPPDMQPDMQQVTISTYTREQRDRDDALLNYYQQLSAIENPDITYEELITQLQALQTIKPETAFQAAEKQTLFYWDGKIYTINPASLLLQEYSERDDPRGRMPKATNASQLPFLTQLLAAEAIFALKETKPNKIFSPQDQDTHIQTDEQVFVPLTLADGDAMELKFVKNGQEAQLVIERKGNKYIAVGLSDEGQKISADETSTLWVDNSTILNCIVHKNVLQIRQLMGDCAITIIENPQSGKETEDEINRGKGQIVSNVTTNYGEEVWRDPRRILLDAMQNHIDASEGNVPEIRFTVQNPDGRREQVSEVELQGRDASWQIVGIEIHDEGNGYTTPYITALGKTTKGDADRGKYGEGLKMLAASALRQGIGLEYGSRDWRARPVSKLEQIKNYETDAMETFDMLAYNMDWQNKTQQGSYTAFTLPTEDAAHANGERRQVWNAWVEVMDPRQQDAFGRHGLERFVLPPQEDAHTDGIVTVLTDTPGLVYEKNLMIPGDISEPMLFGYNIDETIIDTRERNQYNKELFEGYLELYFQNLRDPEIMRQILTRVKEDPTTHYYEYRFLSPLMGKLPPETLTLWRKTYYEVFGTDAILSLKPEMDALIKAGGNWNRAGQQRLREVSRAVANEVHLANQNLQLLPFDLTKTLSPAVYTSIEFSSSFEAEEADIALAEKEKVVAFLRTINQLIVAQLESIDSDADSRAFLENVVPREALEARKQHLLDITPDDVVIKGVGFPFEGMVEEVEGRPRVYLNQKIIGNALEVLATHVHEASHYLSGQRDYSLGFMRFMMMLAST